jgi:hypothetical protein
MISTHTMAGGAHVPAAGGLSYNELARRADVSRLHRLVNALAARGVPTPFRRGARWHLAQGPQPDQRATICS